METKQLDQFRCDYFMVTDEISVNARWLQGEMQKLQELRLKVKDLEYANGLLRGLVATHEYQEYPKYRLNVRS